MAQRDVTGHITLRLRYKTGPWATKLPVKPSRAGLRDLQRVRGLELALVEAARGN